MRPSREQEAAQFTSKYMGLRSLPRPCWLFAAVRRKGLRPFSLLEEGEVAQTALQAGGSPAAASAAWSRSKETMTLLTRD